MSSENKEKQATKLAAGLPSKGKLLCNLEQVTKEDRARAGITDEMANAMVSSNQPKPKGVQVARGPWQAREDSDVETQVRVIDHDSNRVLFSGSEAEFKALKRIMTNGGG